MYYILFLTLFQALQINNGMHVGQYAEEVEKVILLPLINHNFKYIFFKVQRAEDKYDEPDVQVSASFYDYLPENIKSSYWSREVRCRLY